MHGDPGSYQPDSTAGRLRKLAQASSIIASTRPLDNLPKVLAEQAKTITNSHFCIVHLNTPDHVAITCSEDYVWWQDHVDLLDALVSAVGAADRPVRLTEAELEAQPAWIKVVERLPSRRPVCGWLAIPLIGTDQAHLGLIQLLDSSEGEFSEEDELLVGQLAQVAALIFENNAWRGKAHEVVQARDEFLSLVSHELKNPITSLRGFAQLLLRQLDRGDVPDPEKLRRTLQSIEQVSERLTRLINDVREVVRLDGGRVTLDLKAVDMGTLAESVAAEFQSSLSRRPITVDGSEPVRTLVDPLRWRQLLIHLIEYISASSTGSGPIEIEILNQDGRSPQLAIIDRESSISSEDWQQLIDRVQRSRSPTALGGAGLSLYIAYCMIRLHGGQLGVEALTDGATRIVVGLPSSSGKGAR
jgi:signal transduction histidine kinase